MQFNVLGPVSVRSGSEGLSLGGPKQRTVMAMLIANAGRIVSSDELIQAVWGDNAAPKARRTIQTYVSNLRSVVGDTIEKAGAGWMLSAERTEVDALLFEDLYVSTQGTKENSPESIAEVLRKALGLWRGHPYADVEAHGYLEAEVTRLNELRNAVTAARIDADLALGKHAELIGEIDALLSAHPYQERFRAQHMLALYRAGRQKAALQSYAEIRTLLVGELGIDPSTVLQDLEQQILMQDPALDLAPRTIIYKRAVLVVDAGDPIELAGLSSAWRDDLLQRSAQVVADAERAEGADRVDLAGMASYVTFDTPARAAAAAQVIASSDRGQDLRMAVDWGDVEIGDDAVFGPPVRRGARLVAAAHPGQVLISSDAQQGMTGPSGQSGMRIEALGEYQLSGVDGGVFIYQLLIGNPPREFPELLTDRVPPPMPRVVHPDLPGYELRDRIGFGSVGPIFRGYQPSVGREVAVEVVHKGDSTDADFIRHFEADVQRISLLEHPNILPVLDYWRDTDGAYIVYPYHRGGRLDISLGETDAAPVVGAIASALAYAHSYGIAHGQLSSSRVILDESRNPYLYGFPIGGITTRDPDLAAYAAPETVGGQPSVSGDIYSLGVLTRTLFTGSEPDPDTELDLHALDDEIQRVVAKATLIDPSGRYASVDAFIADLLPRPADHPQERYTEARNPYKGLEAFQESDATDFYGRAAAAADLIDTLEHHRFVAVVGPSGIGKSSLVRAGLIPALRKGALAGSEQWLITDMLPGSDPFRELERSLERVAVDLPIDLRERLIDRNPEALEFLDPALPDGSPVLLVVDQFEELFTMVDGDTALRFLDLLLTASRNDRIRVVATLRVDFLDRPLQYSEFGELLRNGMVTLRSPSRDELAEAIVEPANSVGITVDSALTERIIAEAHDQPGVLPLLQHTLAELFEARTSDVLTVEDHDALGGIRGSLARRAEGIYLGFDTQDRDIAKQILLQLVAMEVDARPSRRRVTVSSLDYLVPDRVLEGFADGRLIVLDRHPVSHEPTVEVAHEALFTHWPRLAGWIADLQEHIVLRRALAESAVEWEAHDHGDAYLLTPARTAQHVAWATVSELTLTKAETDYLDASMEWNEHQASKRVRRRRGIMVGFAAAAIIAAGFGVAAAINANQAQKQAGIAHSRELAASAIKVLDDDPELSVLLALAAASGADPTFESVSALHEALTNDRMDRTVTWPDEWPVFPGLTGSISPDGQLLAVTGGLNQLAVWDLASNSEEPIWSFETQTPDYATIVPHFTSDGQRVVATVAWFSVTEPANEWPDPPPETGVYVWDARTGDVLNHFRGPYCPPMTIFQSGTFIDDSLPVGVGVPTSDDCAFTGALDVWLMDLATGEMTLAYDQPVFSYPWGTDAAFSDDGRYFSFVDGASTSSVVDLETGEIVLEVSGGQASRVSRDGSRLLAASKSAISVWDLNTRTQVWMDDSPVRLNTVAFTEEAKLVVAPTEHGQVRVLDAAAGRLLHELKGHPTSTWFTSTTTDHTRLASFSLDRVVRIWDLTANAQGEIAGFDLPGWPVRHSGMVVGDRGATLQYPDATSAAREPGVAVVFDVSSGEVVREFTGYGGQGVRLSPDGSLLAGQPYVAPGILGPPHIRDIETGEVLVELEGFCTFDVAVPAPGTDCTTSPELRGLSLWWADFSHDGSMIAVGGAHEGIVGVWDVASGQLLEWLSTQPLLGNDGVVVKFSPESDLLLTAAAGLAVYETDGWSEIANLALGWSWLDLLFSHDGRYVIASDTTHGIVTVDTETWEFVGESLPGHGGGLYAIDTNDDGTLIASGSGDGFVRVSNLETKELLQALPVGDMTITVVEFINDNHILVIGQGIPALVMTIDLPELIDIARSEVTRGLTPQECATYHVDPCPTLAETRSIS